MSKQQKQQKLSVWEKKKKNK